VSLLLLVELWKQVVELLLQV
jgi:hypothetical protein